MPGGTNPAEYKIAAGELNRPLKFYLVPPPLDQAGGVIDPAPEAVNPTFLWNTFGGVLPYQGLELRSADSKWGETWVRIVLRFSPSRRPREGMRVVDVWTSDEFEITGVEPTANRRLRVECTARRLGA